MCGLSAPLLPCRPQRREIWIWIQTQTDQSHKSNSTNESTKPSDRLENATSWKACTYLVQIPFGFLLDVDAYIHKTGSEPSKPATSKCSYSTSPISIG